MTLAELSNFQDVLLKQDGRCTCFVLTVLPAKQGKKTSCKQLTAMWTFNVFH